MQGVVFFVENMPIVKKGSKTKKFPYTKKGIKAAKADAKKTGGSVGFHEMITKGSSKKGY